MTFEQIQDTTSGFSTQQEIVDLFEIDLKTTRDLYPGIPLTEAANSRLRAKVLLELDKLLAEKNNVTERDLAAIGLRSIDPLETKKVLQKKILTEGQRSELIAEVRNLKGVKNDRTAWEEALKRRGVFCEKQKSGSSLSLKESKNEPGATPGGVRGAQ